MINQSQEEVHPDESQTPVACNKAVEDVKVRKLIYSLMADHIRANRNWKIDGA